MLAVTAGRAMEKLKVFGIAGAVDAVLRFLAIRALGVESQLWRL